MPSTTTILIVVGLIVVIVLASRYIWDLHQKILVLQEQAKDFVTLDVVETHVANLAARLVPSPPERKNQEDHRAHIVMLEKQLAQYEEHARKQQHPHSQGSAPPPPAATAPTTTTTTHSSIQPNQQRPTLIAQSHPPPQATTSYSGR